MAISKFRRFYQKIEENKKIAVWILAVIIALSLFRFCLWTTRKTRTAGPKAYMRQLNSGNAEEKKQAIYTLGKTGIKSAIPEIEQILKGDPDDGVKRVAAWSLGVLDIDRLAALLGTPQKNTKYIVMEALMKLDDKNNMAYLVQRFPEEDTEIKRKILSYIDSVYPASYQKELVKIAENSAEDKSLRLKSLEMLKKRDVRDFENRLWNLYYNDEDEDIRNKAYEILQDNRR